ncbi:terminus macrodomain insulation protein YfbV [Psychromonas ossibalaenae]|uniref:terminus macrodomain insulation protein YfbV n=1 Tax=Psychromonas ossibalaenae TaxID=444922 RepID=UPI000382531C|nr:terminus macrodomain insulation protein YfbV [Psychromonas ossibalaenae]
MNLFTDVVKQGDHYLKTWPKQPTLNCLFIDSKVVYYTQLLIKTVPAFVMLVVGLNILFPSLFVWPITVTFVLFLLGLPIQGLYWLGKRSQELLPNKLLPWYIAIQSELSGKRCELEEMLIRPSYLDLARLLKNAFKIGGDNFLQNHELI